MITIIAALTEEYVIGKDNKLPWNLPEDLQNFKRLTSGNVVVMGRKTYDSLPEKFKPLPNRYNVVVSSSMPEQEGLDVCRSIDDAVSKAQSYGKEIFVIGGSAIYKQFLPIANRMILSFVKENYEGDTYFPKFNKANWREVSKQQFPEFDMITYLKNEKYSPN